MGAINQEPDPLDEFGGLPDADEAAVTQPGDIWRLGEHIILCGNARDAGGIKFLLDRTAVAAVFSDPPYNVPVNGHVRSGSSRFAEFAEASGEMAPDEFIAFLAEALGISASMLGPGGIMYVFMDWRHMKELQAAFDRIGMTIINLCVWSKTKSGMGSLYRSRHELVFVTKRLGARHRNNVQLGKNGRDRSNVWEYAGATGGKKDEADDFALHPTVKPVRLVMDAILDVTALGETVLDPFLGSGTTLLAAERTRRRCVGVEISPAYVDVAIRRWQDMTGRDAVHAGSGLTFLQRLQKIENEGSEDVPPKGAGPGDGNRSRSDNSDEGRS